MRTGEPELMGTMVSVPLTAGASMLGAMTLGMQRAHPQRTQVELIPVLERLVIVGRPRLAMDMDGRARGDREASVTRDVIGMVVGLEDVLDAHAHVPGEIQVLVDLETRIDDRCHPSPLIADQIRSAPEIVMGNLTKDHLAS